MFLISPVSCFVVFTTVIKFSFHNGLFEHCKEVLGITLKHTHTHAHTHTHTHTKEQKELLCNKHNVSFSNFCNQFAARWLARQSEAKMLFFLSYIANHLPLIEEGEWWPHACLFLPCQAGNCDPDYSGNQLHWMSSYIQSEMLRLVGSTCSRLMDCSRY